MPTTQALLVETSRTFALAIPLLPEPTRSAVCLSYLLFRIADTLEDAEAWPRARRVTALEQFAALLERPEVEAGRWLSREWLREPPTRNEGYLELLGATDQVLSEVLALAPQARAIALRHARRTALGMKGVLENHSDAEGRVLVGDLVGLRDYCYVVAGIVGELLTELFMHGAPSLERVAAVLHENERAFGEGLQLVNILKDERADAGDGRSYLPRGVERTEVLKLAWSDLVRARRYIDALRGGGAPAGFVAFAALSEELAEATLERLGRDGPGAKVSRTQVFEILARVQREAAGS
ncbi:MAG: squalene/phytoene synthase family protein [Myxococcales bacterium]